MEVRRQTNKNRQRRKAHCSVGELRKQKDTGKIRLPRSCKRRSGARNAIIHKRRQSKEHNQSSQDEEEPPQVVTRNSIG